MISVTVQRFRRRVKTYPGFTWLRNQDRTDHHTECIERRTFRFFGIPFFAIESIVATNL